MSAIAALSLELQQRSDAALHALCADRPDLISPPVPDFAALAARACSRLSVHRAVDRLTTAQIQIIEASLVLNGPVTPAALKPLLRGSNQRTLTSALNRLHDLALFYQVPGGLLPVGALHEVLGTYPAGLGRSYHTLSAISGDFLVATATRLGLLPTTQPAVEAQASLVSQASQASQASEALADRFAEPQWWSELLQRAPERTSELLTRLESQPLATLPAPLVERPLNPAATEDPADSDDSADSQSPVGFLLAEGLLIPLGGAHLELVREAGLRWREGAVVTDFSATFPAAAPGHGAASAPLSVLRRENAALAAVTELLHDASILMESVTHAPVPTLRHGGVGVRALRSLSQQAGVDESRAAFLLELLAASGMIELLAETSQWSAARSSTAHPGPDVLWFVLPRVEQWSALTQAWLQMDRAPSLIGRAEASISGRPAAPTINALSAEVRRADAPALRSLLLDVLGTSANPEQPSELLRQAAWLRPRLWRRVGRLAEDVLAEAEALGITGAGTLSSFGAFLARGEQSQAEETLRTSLPAPLGTILLQADLTAVAPGYLEPALSRELALLADREGRGPAAFYRFSADSLRRALDAGREAEGVLAFLAQHSATPIPQPLEYLIRDAASRHGIIRLTPAATVLTGADAAGLLAVAHDSALSDLGLREMAPGVLISPVGPAELSRRLRAVGHSPVLEPAAGRPGSSAEVTVQASALETELESRLDGHPPDETGAEWEIQLTRLRQGPSSAPFHSTLVPQVGLETLREAIRTRKQVALTVVDSEGNQERLRLVPLSVNSGRVRVFDPVRDTERLMSIHRILDVDLLDAVKGPAHE
ncbi:helicase-associated domain-containing protein [Psychromicrobium xiongbiense]|uniref:helicase-associated domain-containing protein n=1 Tax=Psychromicrobium xiongbiense TaxID=3051184 RepID=UPI002552CE6A|nr:helicase-associated domain-containing protein [Psychromicrobium sp. YIM S02556]